jgi:pimeloyl-ACP methyl ester carboxylesterase
MSSGRSRCPPPTWRASREAASSPRSWRSATPRLSGVSSSRALGRCRTLTRARGAFSFRSFVDVAPSERTFVEGCFLWIYPARAHNNGTVDQIIEEVLAFPHKQSTEDLQRFLDAFLDHDTTDRLGEIAAPTLVLAGGRDMTSRPELCRAVAELIPDARFEVMEEEAHQPFQEVPDEWNARVDAFWHEVQARG